jgi:hypothetical protein
MPYHGLNFEDAILVSESAAKKLSSEHMYQLNHEVSEDTQVGRKEYMSMFPGKFKPEQLKQVGDNGIIKPGATVRSGDPIILSLTKAKTDALHRAHKQMWTDSALCWEHNADGTITDVSPTKEGGWNVTVKSYAPAEVGDKICFDPETDVLTRNGWKHVSDITMQDEIATLNPDTDVLEYQHPTRLISYDYTGDMFYLNTKHLNMLVTPDHELWASRDGKTYSAVPAKQVFESVGTWRFKKDCNW